MRDRIGPAGGLFMKTALIGFCFALAAASAANAGAVIQTAERDVAGDGDKAITTVYAQDGKLRFETLRAGRKLPEHIVIFKDDALYMLDGEHNTYTTMDHATMQRI